MCVSGAGFIVSQALQKVSNQKKIYLKDVKMITYELCLFTLHIGDAV